MYSSFSFNNCFFIALAAKVIFTYIMNRVKQLLIAFTFLLPGFAWSQDCVIQKEKDPYTKEVRLSTGFIDLKNAKLSIQADSREIDFLFVITGKDKCFSDASTASVFFEGTKVKTNIRNTGSMNCDGFFHFNFKNQASIPSLLQKMAAQKVTSILFVGNDKKETQLTIPADQQQLLMHFISCLLEEAKFLLPI